MDANLINSKASGLSHRINCALRHLIPHCMLGLLHEPDYVALLTENFTLCLERILETTFPQYIFDVAGVFCHQSPIVSYSANGKGSELGDILFVYVEADSIGRARYNSLLLQVKMIGDEYPKSVEPNEQHQLYLYQNWPEFTYQKPKAFAGMNVKRDIQPKTINDGAQYLLIDPQHAGRCCKRRCLFRRKRSCNGIVTEDCEKKFFMGCAVPSQTLIVDKCLSWELLDFLKFKAGRTFEGDPFNTKDDWTKMIWDLLMNSWKSYNRKNINHINKKRGVFTASRDFPQTTFAKNLTHVINDFYGIKDNDGIIFEKDESGVSVIVIESRPKNNKKE